METLCDVPVAIHEPQGPGSGRMSSVGALQQLLQELPLSTEKQQLAEELIKQCSLSDLEQLGLGPPQRPIVPRNIHRLEPEQRLQAIQRVINSLQYNHAPGYMYNVSKDRPYNVIMNTAREVLKDALPIKCVEAVFLGLLLTSDWPELDRYPVGFKSKCAGNTYRHIVLAVRHVPTNTWGALGISRRAELQYKPLGLSSLSDLMADYKASYEMWGHSLYKIRVGLPVEHDSEYTGAVCWRYTNISCGRHPWDKCCAVLNAFAENSRMLANRFKVLGFRPPSRSGADASNAPASRVALRGTTPQPGATRPPLPAIAKYRHASVSPVKRRAQAPAAQGTTTGTTRAAQDRSRSTTSAPPRQRPTPPQGAKPVVNNRPSLPFLQPSATAGRDRRQPSPAKHRGGPAKEQAVRSQVQCEHVLTASECPSVAQPNDAQVESTLELVDIVAKSTLSQVHELGNGQIGPNRTPIDLEEAQGSDDDDDSDEDEDDGDM